jgi:hypothetical protein
MPRRSSSCLILRVHYNIHVSVSSLDERKNGTPPRVFFFANQGFYCTAGAQADAGCTTQTFDVKMRERGMVNKWRWNVAGWAVRLLQTGRRVKCSSGLIQPEGRVNAHHTAHATALAPTCHKKISAYGAKCRMQSGDGDSLPCKSPFWVPQHGVGESCERFNSVQIPARYAIVRNKSAASAHGCST